MRIKLPFLTNTAGAAGGSRRVWLSVAAALILCLGAGLGCKTDMGVTDKKPKDMSMASDDAGGGACDTSRCENPDSTCCNGESCIDVQTNPFHCGGCGKVCGAREICSGGLCVCRGGGRDAACGGGSLCCSDGCREVMKDTANCGGCGRACVKGETCEGGSCKCGPAGLACRSGQECCGSGCSNLMDDPKNCGKCGKECAMGKACKNGLCEGECAAPCMLGETCCSGACINLFSNPTNCGMCGRDCTKVTGIGICTGNVCWGEKFDMGPPPALDMTMPRDM